MLPTALVCQERQALTWRIIQMKPIKKEIGHTMKKSMTSQKIDMQILGERAMFVVTW